MLIDERDALTRQVPWLQRALAYKLTRSFRDLSCGDREDALSCTLLVLVERRGEAEAILDRDGLDGLYRWLSTIAWRCARGLRRRASRRREVSATVEQTQEVTAEHQVHLEQVVQAVDGLVVEASRRYAPQQAVALEEALWERFLQGSTDGAVAKRHGLHRETVNRAKNWVRRQLAA